MKDSLLAQVISRSPLAGCKWCKKTIFWNGSFWNHVDGDIHRCHETPHALVKTGQKPVEAYKTFFFERPVFKNAPVYKCSDCGLEVTGEWSSYSTEDDERWYVPNFNCPAKVATPMEKSKGEPT